MIDEKSIIPKSADDSTYVQMFYKAYHKLLYTAIALCGRSIRYSFVKSCILFPPVRVGLRCLTCFVMF